MKRKLKRGQQSAATPVRPIQRSSCYIYGIADLGQRIVLKKPRAIEPGTKIYTIPYKDICALVSPATYQEYDPEDEKITRHNEALEASGEELGCTILPLRFSTIARTEQDVLKILSNGYQKFKAKLEDLRGTSEMAVRVFCDVPSFREAVAKEMKNKTARKNPKSLEEEMSRRSFLLASKLFKNLKAISFDSALNELIFEDEILNATFLIPKNKEKEFRARIDAFTSKFGGNYLRVQPTGPYLPYSFMEPPEG